MNAPEDDPRCTNDPEWWSRVLDSDAVQDDPPEDLTADLDDLDDIDFDEIPQL